MENDPGSIPVGRFGRGLFFLWHALHIRYTFAWKPARFLRDCLHTVGFIFVQPVVAVAALRISCTALVHASIGGGAGVSPCLTQVEIPTLASTSGHWEVVSIVLAYLSKRQSAIVVAQRPSEDLALRPVSFAGKSLAAKVNLRLS